LPASQPADLPELITPHLRLRHAQPSMARAVAQFMVRNEAHFRRWDPPRPADIGTAAHWRSQLATAVRDFRAGAAVRWVLFDSAAAEHAPVLGRVNFTQIFRGPFQSCVLGYQLDARAQGKGLMTEALRATLDDLFEVRGLHRVQAAYLPENERSGKLLLRLGFTPIGIARRYLFIDGAWRDHALVELVAESFEPVRVPRS
jgi:[ribosomal protein S5]-alanine N-acetyltransferase